MSVINALVTKSDRFDNYIAIDPSLWWDNQAFLHIADSILSVNRFNNKALFVGIANTMGQDMEFSTVGVDTSKNTTHIRSILHFVQSVDKKENGLHFGWKYYENDDHSSVPLITEYDALRFLFPWHWFKGLDELYKDLLPADESIQLVRSHYANVSSRLGYEVLPDEGLVNRMGISTFGRKSLIKLLHFFDLNIQNYPNSNNIYD